MAKIVLTRIDNRLIHGQIATQWCRFVKADLLMVVSDEVAEDELRKSLMSMAAPAYAQTRFFSVEKACEMLKNDTSDKQIIMICETVQDVLRLMEGGVDMKQVNIGNMHKAEGKRQVASAVAVDEQDIACFKTLRDQGVALEIRQFPDGAVEPIDPIFA